MITGFNTDIEHDGVVYHVQTEDKGLDTPIILSLVYVGGAILASKRAPYEDLIAEGFSDEVLAERLKRQHKLICAAINNGRIDDLKKMTQRASDAAAILESSASSEGVVPSEEVVPPEESVSTEIVPNEEKEFAVVEQSVETIEEAVTPPAEAASPVESEEFILEPDEAEMAVPEPEPSSKSQDLDEFEFESYGSQQWVPPEKVEPPAPEPEPEIETPIVVEVPHHEAYTVHDPRGQLQVQETTTEDGLQILLLDEAQFYSGESRILRVLVVNRQGDNEKPLSGTPVSVKILGTAFRPLIYSLKTDRDGVVTLETQIPQFTSGRAAVLIRAATKEQAAELRRVIHPAR